MPVAEQVEESIGPWRHRAVQNESFPFVEPSSSQLTINDLQPDRPVSDPMGSVQSLVE